MDNNDKIKTDEIRYAVRINHPNEVRDTLYKVQKLLHDNFGTVEIPKDDLEVMVTNDDMYRNPYLVFNVFIDRYAFEKDNTNSLYLRDDTGLPYLIVLGTGNDRLTDNEGRNWYNTGYKIPESVIETIPDPVEYDNTDENSELVNYINGIINDEEVDADNVSDGYHTFNELYNDRTKLFAVILNSHPEVSWKCRRHANKKDKMPEGMFIAGINTPEGQFTYHQKLSYWDEFKIPELISAPTYDGHADKDIDRLSSLWLLRNLLK